MSWQRAWCVQAAEVIPRAVRRWRMRRRLSTALAFRPGTFRLCLLCTTVSLADPHAHAVVGQWRPECRHWTLPEVQAIVERRRAD